MHFVIKLFNNSKMSVFSFVFLGIIFFSIYSYADWQKTLESSFDIVETFDQLKEWTGTNLSGGYVAKDLPVKLNDSKSIWGEYNCETGGTSISGPWIGDHNGSNEWVSGQAKNAEYHKSLRMDYDNRSFDHVAYGPSRLRTFFGSGSPTDGYTDVFVFMMVKMNSGFYPTKIDGSYPATGYHKFLHMSTGFRDVHNWGTPEQQALCGKGNYPQCAYIYGLNYYIVHTYTGPYPDDPFWRWRPKYSNTQGDNKIDGTDFVSNVSIEQFVDTGSWFGVEMHFHLGSKDVSDGYARLWVYDSNGKEMGNDQSPNTMNLAKYEHRYNLLNIGGNRAIDKYVTATSADYYIDDVIIHNSRIGPKYFLLLGKTMTSSVTSSEVPIFLSHEPPPAIPKIWIIK